MSSTSRGDLLDQSSYADAISRRIDGSVSRSWVSKATKNGKTVADHFRPDLDAVFDGDQLVGYQDPKVRSGGDDSSGAASTSRNGAAPQDQGPPERGGNGTSGAGNVRRNPGIGNANGGGLQTGGTVGLSGIDKMAGSVGEAINKSPAFRRGAIRFGGAAGGFLLVSLLYGKSANLGAAAIGALFGFGIAEYSIQTEPPAAPTKRLPPGMENGQR